MVPFLPSSRLVPPIWELISQENQFPTPQEIPTIISSNIVLIDNSYLLSTILGPGNITLSKSDNLYHLELARSSSLWNLLYWNT